MPKEKLLLPTIDGEPDWKFMENSIKDFYQKIIIITLNNPTSFLI